LRQFNEYLADETNTSLQISSQVSNKIAQKPNPQASFLANKTKKTQPKSQ